MGKNVKLALWLCFTCVALSAAPVPVRDSMVYAGQTRFHYIYVPSALRPEKPLVITQKQFVLWRLILLRLDQVFPITQM